MRLKIKTLDDKNFFIDIEENNTVSILKNLIENIQKIDKGCQRLIFQGSPMMDEKTMKDYNIKENTTIFLIQTLQYGML
jgi:ubiquitin C